MKKIITLFVFIVTGVVTYASPAQTFEFKSEYEEDHVYEMKVSELTDLLKSVDNKIYGYKGHGGDIIGNIDYFEKNYCKKYNEGLQEKGLNIERTNDKDIIFKYECNTTDTITITLLTANGIQKEDRNHNQYTDWSSSSPIEIKWIVGSGYVAPTAGVENTANIDETTNIAQENDIENAPNHQTDETSITLYILIGINLIILFILCQVVRNIKHIIGRINQSSAESQTSTQAPKIEAEINNLAKQIEKLLDNDVKLKNTLIALGNDVKKLSEKISETQKHVTTQVSGNQGPSQQETNTPVYNEEEIGNAGFDEDDKCLSCKAVTVALFKITKINQEYKFSLIDSDEVRNYIETQGAMLNQYKQWNVIAFDKLVNNGKVSVVNKGELRRIDDSTYEVISPLYLKFE